MYHLAIIGVFPGFIAFPIKLVLLFCLESSYSKWVWDQCRQEDVLYFYNMLTSWYKHSYLGLLGLCLVHVEYSRAAPMPVGIGTLSKNVPYYPAQHSGVFQQTNQCRSAHIFQWGFAQKDFLTGCAHSLSACNANVQRPLRCSLCFAC